MAETMRVVNGEWLLEFTGVTSSTSSHLLATTNKFVDKDIRVTAVAAAGDYQADSSAYSNSEVTPKISNLHATATSTYGFITTLPSGVTATNGTNYLLIDPDATATAWSVTPRAMITTSGYIATGSKLGTAISNSPTIKAGTSYYIPILGGGQAAGVTLAGGGFSTKTSKNEVTVVPNVEIKTKGTFFTSANLTAYGVVSTAPSGGTDGTTYLTIDAEGSVKTTGKAKATVVLTRGAITYSNDAGIIAAHNATNSNLGASDSSSITPEVNITPGITDSFAPKYIPIVSGITLAGGDLSTTTNTNEVTTAPKVTVASSGTFKTTSGYGVTTTKPSGTDGTNYLTIDGTGTPTNGTAKSTVKITKAAITYSNNAGVIAAHTTASTNIGSTNSGDVTKEVTITPTVADNFAPLYIPIRTVAYTTTVVNTSNNTVTSRGTASISAGAIAATTLPVATFAAQATSGKTYVDISNTTAAPVLVTGYGLYINAGYVDNLYISLDKLVPDGASANLTGDYILSGYSAYNNAGALISGTIQTYNGTYT